MFNAVDVYVVKLNSCVIAIYPYLADAKAFCAGVLFENSTAQLEITYNNTSKYKANID